MRAVAHDEHDEKVFAAIGDGTRRILLRRLAEEGEKSVTELVEPLSISQPAVSRHLRCLREAGLVRRRSDGRQRIYAIDARKLRVVHDWVSHFERFWDDKLDALGSYLDRRKPPGAPPGNPSTGDKEDT